MGCGGDKGDDKGDKPGTTKPDPTKVDADAQAYSACFVKHCGDPGSVFDEKWGEDPANKQKELAFARENAKAKQFTACACKNCRNFDTIRKSYLFPEVCTQAGVGADGKGDKGDEGKSGAGGLRIRSPHASIEMGGDVKIFRAGANKLAVDAAVKVNGAVTAKSIKIGGVPLDEYIRNMVKALLAKQQN